MLRSRRSSSSSSSSASCWASAFTSAAGKSAKGYFAAHGQIGWFVNGVAFAGDYLSAASFLGICGMIAFYGYDGFLYSIGYLAGWIVALFVIAEPIKRLGKYTFADALDAKFNSRGIKLAAAISTLVVSIFYLIPQMVGAGALVQAAARLAALGGRGDRRRGGACDRRDGRHGEHDLGAVHQGLAAGDLLRDPDDRDSEARISRDGDAATEHQAHRRDAAERHPVRRTGRRASATVADRRQSTGPLGPIAVS